MRDHDWRSAPVARRARRREPDPLGALQRAVGNRGMAQVLARQHGTFENSVRVGPLGPIEVRDSNVADWIAHKDDAADLTVTTVMGRHSAELKRKADSKERVATVEVQTITGQNSWIVVTFTNARIRAYEADASAKTEHWTAVDFDGVHIKRTSIGVPRP